MIFISLQKAQSIIHSSDLIHPQINPVRLVGQRETEVGSSSPCELHGEVGFEHSGCNHYIKMVPFHK